MANYIDGFAFPIMSTKLSAYRAVADAVAAIWIEHGALDYREFVGDDLHREGCSSFVDALNSENDESIIFGWITFQSRDARDIVNQKIESDSRMHDLVSPLLSPDNPVFDPMKMAYGGFKPLIHRSADSHGDS